jgi:hypothetical protein
LNINRPFPRNCPSTPNAENSGQTKKWLSLAIQYCEIIAEKINVFSGMYF